MYPKRIILYIFTNNNNKIGIDLLIKLELYVKEELESDKKIANRTFNEYDFKRFKKKVFS